ncbi:MAG: hydrogenase formation protein HypD [Rhodospirillum sp.]|nr:hydrogenase formation protein HypD [Rhodospirillum sp.]MCF8489216.1 hydrogenase formation protein HypD [Rhodospirillum sp.]MCF8502453.1 hydrogenase formation protein HypD [Rhodospirillum sp.]
MKYVDEYRDGALAKGLLRAIARAVRADRSYAFMEFCGGHTHAIARHGIIDVLPQNLRMIHGPGCPVCVLPMGRLDAAMALARDPAVTLCTYADLMRVPGSHGETLIRAKADGADVRMIYSPLDALGLAEANPERQVVFLAIGFETTTPPTAAVVKAAEAKDLRNFSVFCNHVLTPMAMRAILEAPAHGEEAGPRLDGLVGPSHVSTIIGTDPYRPFPERYGVPVVVAGFEPVDILHAILMLVRQVNDDRAEVENQYVRAVTAEGNRIAQALMAEVFEHRESFEWRGLGTLPDSALRLRPRFARFDAERRFDMSSSGGRDHPGCACGAVLRGRLEPWECKLFGRVCTPDTPIGACMVSSEGACAAAWLHGSRSHSPDVPEEVSHV